mmetsp:Transcript_68368/g.164064  ORF Transcript_68368/g.164064 Transcript_68368/m.164064 type:complete len:307 (-) Transcript_68368:59-979(-)
MHQLGSHASGPLLKGCCVHSTSPPPGLDGMEVDTGNWSCPSVKWLNSEFPVRIVPSGHGAGGLEMVIPTYGKYEGVAPGRYALRRPMYLPTFAAFLQCDELNKNSVDVEKTPSLNPPKGQHAFLPDLPARDSHYPSGVSMDSGGKKKGKSKAKSKAKACHGGECSLSLDAVEMASTSDVCSNDRVELCVAYLPRSATAGDLRKTFEAFGPEGCVSKAWITRTKDGTSKCYGFVQFTRPGPASVALEECNRGRVLMNDAMGKAWHVKASWAKNPGPLRNSRAKAEEHTPNGSDVSTSASTAFSLSSA